MQTKYKFKDGLSKYALAITLWLLTSISCFAGAGPQTSEVKTEAYKTIIYVSEQLDNKLETEANGTIDLPYSDLKTAITNAPEGSAIFVAKGHYAVQNLKMKSGIDIYGGYDPKTWSRDIWKNRSVLDGDGKGRVILAANDSRLDGFEVRGGLVKGHGAGIYIDNVSPIISNNIIAQNKTLRPSGWAPKHWHERAHDGGGLYCTNEGAPKIYDNLFVQNTTVTGRGAALAFDFRCQGEVTGNVIMNNVAGTDDPMRSSDGGGISVFDWSAPLLANNIVLNNTALNHNDAGGIFINLWGKPNVRQNLIVGNYADDDAGGLFLGGQEHRYDKPLDPMPPSSDYHVKISGNKFHGNSNSSKNSGATRITMETRTAVDNNIAALNSGFYIQRTEGEFTNNTILEDLIFIETKDSLKPSLFENNIVWGTLDYDTNAKVTGNLFRDGFDDNNIEGDPTFRDDVIDIEVISSNYSKSDYKTRVLVSGQLSSGQLKNRVVTGDGKWSVISDATPSSITLWGDMSGVSSFTVISNYDQSSDSVGIGKGATTKQLSTANWSPTRINKSIELLERKQPIYYAAGYGGYDKGLQMSGTWADYIVYNMEHQPLDFGLLRDFMRGLVDAGPTASGHRTPAVIVVLPLLGLDDDTVEAGGWMVEQALAQGVHGIHLARARDPEAVKRFVQAARYPIHDEDTRDLGIGLRGWGSQKFAAWVWGISEQDYLQKADVWPLNPSGELMLGVKIEDKQALSQARKTLAVPGLAFAEHGPRDLGLSYGYLDGRADPPLPAEINKAGDKVLKLTQKHGIYFLDNVLPDNVKAQLDRGVMIGAGRREDAAAIGREYTKREMPW